jgi:uncharacterized protein YndB with AHSA1/START domain
MSGAVVDQAIVDQASAVVKETEIIMSRTLNAPRQLVWKAITQPEHLTHWWGPNGFTNTFTEFNFAVGGVWRFVMHGPDGKDYNNRIIFTEITPIERFAYDHDGDDNRDDVMFRVVMTLEDRGKQTFITLHQFAPNEVMIEQMKKFGAVEGGKQTLARLESYLQSMS